MDPKIVRARAGEAHALIARLFKRVDKKRHKGKIEKGQKMRKKRVYPELG